MTFLKNNLGHLLILGLLVGVGYFISLASLVLMYFENDNFAVVWLRMVNFIKPTGGPFLLVVMLVGSPFVQWILQSPSFLGKYFRCWMPGLLITLVMSLIYFYQQVFPEGQLPWRDPSLLPILLEYSFKGWLYSWPGLVLVCLLPSLYLARFENQMTP